jgi:hypothetical protein
MSDCQITYQTTYKWEDRVILCIGSIDNFITLGDELAQGNAFAFEERDDFEVLVVPCDEASGTSNTYVTLTENDLLEFVSVCEGLRVSPPPSTGYVTLSTDFTIALVTIG